MDRHRLLAHYAGMPVVVENLQRDMLARQRVAAGLYQPVHLGVLDLYVLRDKGRIEFGQKAVQPGVALSRILP